MEIIARVIKILSRTKAREVGEGARAFTFDVVGRPHGRRYTARSDLIEFRICKLIAGDEQYRGAGGSSSGSPPASLLVVPQPLTVKPSHPSHLNPHLGGPHPHPPRKYQCKMCPQVSARTIRYIESYYNPRASRDRSRRSWYTSLLYVIEMFDLQRKREARIHTCIHTIINKYIYRYMHVYAHIRLC